MINILVRLILPFAIAKSSKDFTFLYRLMDKVAKPLPFHYNNHCQLVNSGLSCAIDSVIAALLCIKCPFTDKLISSDSDLSIELRKISLSSKNICQLLNNKELANTQCRDPYEFLAIFLSKFPEVYTCVKLFQSIVNNDHIITSIVDRSSLPIQHISAIDLQAMPDHFYISDLLHKGTINTFDSNNLYLNKYKEVLIVERLLTSPIIIFSIDRHINKTITITQTLTSPNGDRFQLGSIVIYTEGHYKTFYMHDDIWWDFDSSRSHPVHIGDFDKLPPIISTKGVLYFYFPQYMSIDDYFMFHITNEGDMIVGVFENKINPKLIQLIDDYGCVKISNILDKIGIADKYGTGKKLIIMPIDEYVKIS